MSYITPILINLLLVSTPSFGFTTTTNTQFKNTSLIFLSTSALIVSIQSFNTPKKARNQSKVNLLIIFTTLLAWSFLPAPKDLCQEPLARTQSAPAQPNSFKLLARRLSSTGLLLVGEFQPHQPGSEFRFLRCDHSLLGGIWIGHAKESIKHELLKVQSRRSLDEDDLDLRSATEAESIYATFVLQEAIRLSLRPTPQAIQKVNLQQKALIM